MRKYYKYQYSTFTRPNLTADGTVGSSNCAAYSSITPFSGRPAYQAFDSDTGSIWTCTSLPVNLVFYSPNPLKVTNIQCKNRSDGYAYTITAGTVLGSNNNLDWIELTSWTNSNNTQGATFNISLSSNTEFYKYYAIHITAGTGNEASLADVQFTAQERTVIDGTSSDYDFYKDVPSAILQVTKVYYNSIKVKPNELKTINLPTGQYQIEMYGGGGAATTSTTPDYPYGAGSGAGFKGVVNLAAGAYTIEVGGGQVNTSQMGGTVPTYTNTVLKLGSTVLINAGAGESGQWRARYGYGGTLTIDNSVDIVSSEIRSNGNDGTYGHYGSVWRPKGGMSLQDGTSYGAGAGGSSNAGETMNGADGYFYIERLDGNIGYHTVYTCKTVKEVEREYYKYSYTTWEQPVLSSNGEIGYGDFSVAVGPSIYGASYDICYAFDNNINTCWISAGTPVVTMYSKLPLNITDIKIRNRTGFNYAITGYTIECSNDNVTYTQLKTGSNSTVAGGAEWNIPMDYSGYYKYYRLNVTSTNAGYAEVSKITLTATQQGSVISTSQDYDFYKDIDIYKAIK